MKSELKSIAIAAIAAAALLLGAPAKAEDFDFSRIGPERAPTLEENSGQPVLNPGMPGPRYYVREIEQALAGLEAAAISWEDKGDHINPSFQIRINHGLQKYWDAAQPHLVSLSDYEFLGSLEIRFFEPIELSGVSQLENLSRISLRYPQEGFDKYLCSLLNLERLAINDASNVDPKQLYCLRSLRHLRIHASTFKSPVDEEQFANLERLSTDWPDAEPENIQQVDSPEPQINMRDGRKIITIQETHSQNINVGEVHADAVELRLYKSSVQDWSAISGYPDLASIWTGNTLFDDDASAFSKLPQLRLLVLQSLNVDIEPIITAPAITELFIAEHNDVVFGDAKPSESLQKLTLANVDDEDVDGLSRLNSVTELFVGGRFLTKLQWIKGFDNLEKLAIGGTGIRDFSVLNSLPSLKSVMLLNPAIDIAPVIEGVEVHCTTCIARKPPP
ncbi:MAG: hypothetical protein KI792_04355 [Alphaproteobacteria bacterium]|nr:hypothetical protein [Alphaproteobacteria bacterium SS10]